MRVDTHSATKFSFGPAAAESRSSVPPTICLTTPECKSMHGRNWECLRDIFVSAEGYRVPDTSPERPSQHWNRLTSTRCKEGGDTDMSGCRLWLAKTCILLSVDLLYQSLIAQVTQH